MNMINIVKILYMPKLVLHLELLKNTKTVHVQNEYVDNFIEFFVQFLGYFFVRLKETTGKVENRVK